MTLYTPSEAILDSINGTLRTDYLSELLAALGGAL